MRGNAMGDRGVDGVFRNIAAGAQVVILARLIGKSATLLAHLVGGLPCADDHLADAAHRLAVRRQDRERADVVEDVLGRDGLATDAAFGKGDVFGDRAVKMVADHQHIEVFLDRVGGVGHRRVGGRWDDVGR